MSRPNTRPVVPHDANERAGFISGEGSPEDVRHKLSEPTVRGITPVDEADISSVLGDDHASASSEEEGELREEPKTSISRPTSCSSPKIASNKRPLSPSLNDPNTKPDDSLSSEGPSHKRAQVSENLDFDAVRAFKSPWNCMLQIEDHDVFGNFTKVPGIRATLLVDPGVNGAPSLQLGLKTSHDGKLKYKARWMMDAYVNDWAIQNFRVDPVGRNHHWKDKDVIAALPKAGDVNRLIRIQFRSWAQVQGFGGHPNERVLKSGQTTSVIRSLKVLFTPHSPFNVAIWVLPDEPHDKLSEECWNYFKSAEAMRVPPLYHWKDKKDAYFVDLEPVMEHSRYHVAPDARYSFQDGKTVREQQANPSS